MRLKAEKDKIIEALNATNEEWVVRGIMRLLNIEATNKNIAGYTADGQPITNEQLRKRIKAASARVRKGNYVSQEDVEKTI